MPELLPYADNPIIWPKGATLWGQPLPYLLHTPEGKAMIAYDGWWTRERVDAFSDWAATAHRELHQLCGNDRMICITARAKTIRESFAADGRTMTMDAMMAWRPTPAECVRIKEVEASLAAVRDEVRKWLYEAAKRVPEAAEELNGEPEEWSPTQMAFCAMRFPRLLTMLASRGLITSPGATVPDHVYE